jgi:hypothetical protein
LSYLINISIFLNQSRIELQNVDAAGAGALRIEIKIEVDSHNTKRLFEKAHNKENGFNISSLNLQQFTYMKITEEKLPAIWKGVILSTLKIFRTL